MSQETTESPSENSRQGAVFRPTTHEEWLNVIEWAFDYRGDVTLALKSRESLCGYVFNRGADGPDAYLEMFQSDNPAPLKISCRDIQSIHFTGQDTASGKSWEAWVQKKLANRTT